jgi:hypothetical protein
MSQLWWRIKELFSKLVAVALVGAVAFGGYSLYRQGAFRGGFAHAGRVVMRQIPYFGSRFRHFIASTTSGSRPVSYRSGRRAHNRRAYRGSRRHHQYTSRRHHRNRRHR